MATPDLNLLVTLEAVLATGSVARAAQRLRLSPSAMSRALARLRASTGDPLLVRAGRALVPTPRALELRGQVGRLIHDAEAVLRPADRLDPKRLSRTFTLRAREGFVENFAPVLIARAGREAPGVRLSFVHKGDRESAPLREGAVDLETGVVGRSTGPEVRSQPLFSERFVGVVAPRHALARGAMTPARYADARHIVVARQGLDEGGITAALQRLGLERQVVATVDGFSAAVALARPCDAVATVPERHTGTLRAGMHTFALPVPVPAVTVSLLWHPRHEADPAHRWLRTLVLEAIAADR
jgi:DNA-binding transcriptional LysR family regulator